MSWSTAGDVYLGRHDAPDADTRYRRWVAEWLARGERDEANATDLVVVELCDRFLPWAEDYYRPPSTELTHFLPVLANLKDLISGVTIGHAFVHCHCRPGGRTGGNSGLFVQNMPAFLAGGFGGSFGPPDGRNAGGPSV